MKGAGAIMARRKKPLALTSSKPAKASKASAPAKTTGRIVTVREVTQSCVIRTDGQVLAWVEVDGVGAFDLLHDDEKDGILHTYRSALYTLAFPIQIVLLPEPVDLGAEVMRLAEPTGDDFLDAVSQDFADLVRQHAQRLERVTYLVIVPAPSIALARERAQTVISALAPVHPDLRPGLVDTSRIVSLLAQAYGVPLPGPARVYVRAIDRLWNRTLPAPPVKNDQDTTAS